MIRKNVTRTLTRSTIHAYGVNVVDGKPEVITLDPVCAWGDLTQDEAIKCVKEVHGKNMAVTIGNIEVSKEIYACPIDAFVASAVKVEKEDLENE